MRIECLVVSEFVMDGGTMFGVVPKPIWSKMAKPDENNAIRQNVNALYVELDDGRKGIVEAGIGESNKFSDKEKKIFDLSGRWIVDALKEIDIDPTEIEFVLFTHLHWDHAGGAFYKIADGGYEPTFKNATYYIRDQEWDLATSDDAIHHKSYSDDTIVPLEDHQDKIVFYEKANHEILPGIESLFTGGHTAGHSQFTFTSDKGIQIDHAGTTWKSDVKRAVYVGDVCPTRHHLRIPFETAYDTHPLATRSWKLEQLQSLAQAGAVVFFDHDPQVLAVELDWGSEEGVKVKDELRSNRQ